MSKALRADVRRTQALLDALPRQAVVVDAFGHAWQESAGYWYRAFGDSSAVSSFELAQRGPFREMRTE